MINNTGAKVRNLLLVATNAGRRSRANALGNPTLHMLEPPTLALENARYVKAIKEGRVLCEVRSEVPGGLYLHFFEFRKTELLDFTILFESFDYAQCGHDPRFYFVEHGDIEPVEQVHRQILKSLYILGRISGYRYKKLIKQIPRAI